MAAPDFEATDANCHPSRDGKILMAGANPAGRPFSISDVFTQDTGRRANGFMNLYHYKRTTCIFPMKPDNVALSLLLLQDAQSARRSAKCGLASLSATSQPKLSASYRFYGHQSGYSESERTSYLQSILFNAQLRMHFPACAGKYIVCTP
ncbi:hypothetical protein QEZ48_00430 [Aquamicrobium lusatiense]|uniref:hypothetical protein n=1 Tax=Aquamicrobium lusatiense TaxID=89772 RepID=UPI002457A4FB|nr:hypothetical protein [Aquamicrobium lusatiense]MDH4989305.1 hypothetical protein [Aquamicrobium lusatiense]